MVSFVFGPSVPGPQRAERDRPRPGSPSDAATPHPAQPCPFGAGYGQIGFIHGHAGGGRARPPGTRSHGGRGSPATITTLDARARAGRAGTAWLLVLGLKKKVLGRRMGCSGGCPGSPGGREEPSLSDLGLKTQRTCYIRRRWTGGATLGTGVVGERGREAPSPGHVRAPGLDAGG